MKSRKVKNIIPGTNWVSISKLSFDKLIYFNVSIGLVIIALFAVNVISTNAQTTTNQVDLRNITSGANNIRGTYHEVVKNVVTSNIIYSSAIQNKSSNTNLQFANILPTRGDESIYSGIITYTSTLPIKLQIFHSLHLNDSMEDQNKMKDAILLIHNDSIPYSLIVPEYNSSNLFSASIPFTGSGLRFLSEKSFVAIYTVTAQVYNKTMTISNNTSNPDQNVMTGFSTTIKPGVFKTNPRTLLTSAISLLKNEDLQLLRFSELPSSDISSILIKIPKDKVLAILEKMPNDKRQEVLSLIPSDLRGAIMGN